MPELLVTKPRLKDRVALVTMIEAGRGLIVNITWVLDRPHGVTFYEVVKNATNKLTEQMADELRPHRVACLAVSPGFMRLERMDLSPETAAKAESPETASSSRRSGTNTGRAPEATSDRYDPAVDPATR